MDNFTDIIKLCNKSFLSVTFTKSVSLRDFVGTVGGNKMGWVNGVYGSKIGGFSFDYPYQKSHEPIKT